MAVADLKAFIESRPCGELAMRVVPDYPGRVPPILPPQWLGPLRETTPAAT